MNLITRTLFFLIHLTGISLSYGCKSILKPNPVEEIININATFDSQGSYKITSNDQIKIDILEMPQLKNSYRVDAKGYINHPLFKLKVADKSIETVSQRIKHILAPYTRDNIIDVSLIFPLNAPFYISGEVNKPGKYILKNMTWIGHAIALAGGLGKYSTNKITLIRRDGKEIRRYQMNYLDLMHGEGLTSLDYLYIERNDHIHVE